MIFRQPTLWAPRQRTVVQQVIKTVSGAKVRRTRVRGGGTNKATRRFSLSGSMFAKKAKPWRAML